jgi:hypothetical protein
MKLGVTRYLPLVLAALLGTAPAVAEEIDEASRSAARQVGYEGLQAYRAGRYAEALEKLGRAYAVVKAPSLGLWTARAMIQMGQLVEASERSLEVTRLPVSSGDTALQAAAKETAAKERRELEARIPRLRIQIEGAEPDATVSAYSLDKYPVTVGRFRRFVEAYAAGAPAPGNGAHPLIPGSGWDPSWDANLPAGTG